MRLRDAALGVAARCSADILNGRYRLDGLLGSGGAADVHRGFDLRLRRPVAVKVFRPDTGFDIEENVHGEAVILARLHHPGLVAAYDAGQHNGRVFLVMQLIEGTTLRRRIARGPLSVQETARLGADLADALAHAHEASVIHRDVKPSNILLDSSQRPYLTDFGISRLLDATTRTATGTLTGTAAYLSPEQVLGRPVGRPADIYALGLVLLECLTGRLEYEGGPLEAAIARLHRPPVLPSHLPGQLADLLSGMTASEEADRPTASDCARAFAQHDDARPGPGNRPSTSLTPMRPVPDDGPPRTIDRTHRTPARGTDQAPAGIASGRRRVRAVSACAALAAVMATALVVMDNSASHGGDRSGTRVTSTPTGGSEPSDGAVRKGGAATEKTASGRDDAGGGDAVDRRDDRTPSTSDVGAVEGSSATPHRTHLPAAPGGAPVGISPRPPGQVEKAKKATKAEKAGKAKAVGRSKSADGGR